MISVGEILLNCKSIWQTAFGKMLLAKSEQELTDIYNRTIDEIYKAGMDKVEKYADGVWKKNLQKMGK